MDNGNKVMKDFTVDDMMEAINMELSDVQQCELILKLIDPKRETIEKMSIMFDIWSVQDVMDITDCTDERIVKDAMLLIQRKYDTEQGINNMVIQCAIEEVQDASS